MPILNIFHKTQNPEDFSAEAILAQTKLLQAHQPPAQELEARRDKGIDLDMIFPQEIIETLSPLCFNRELEIQVEVLQDTIATLPNGSPIFEDVALRDADGNILYEDVLLPQSDGTVKAGKRAIMEKRAVRFKQKVVQTKKITVGGKPWLVAALGYLNKVWPTIWMSTWHADTMKLRLRTAFHEIRKSMPPEDKTAFSVVLNMIRDLCIARCEDMKEGHKPLLLKVRREDLTVRMAKGNEKTGVR